MRAIQARAHGWKGRGAFEDIGEMKAKEMASEGVKESQPAKRMKVIRKMSRRRAKMMV